MIIDASCCCEVQSPWTFQCMSPTNKHAILFSHHQKVNIVASPLPTLWTPSEGIPVVPIMPFVVKGPRLKLYVVSFLSFSMLQFVSRSLPFMTLTLEDNLRYKKILWLELSVFPITVRHSSSAGHGTRVMLGSSCCSLADGLRTQLTILF